MSERGKYWLNTQKTKYRGITKIRNKVSVDDRLIQCLVTFTGDKRILTKEDLNKTLDDDMKKCRLKVTMDSLCKGLERRKQI